MNKRLIMLMLLITYGLAACSMPYKNPLFEPDRTEFVGLLDARPESGAVDVISIHGMCTHNRDWVVKTARRLGDATRLSYVLTQDPSFDVDGAQVWATDYTDDAGNVVIRNYALVWSPLTLSEKQEALCYDAGVDTDSCDKEYKRKRAKINSQIKSELMNDCFADAIIYLGPSGERIRNAFREIIALISEARKRPANPLFFVTESLGSKVLADSVIEDQASLQRLVATKQIFMAANQLPLLDLADGKDKGFIGGDSIDRLRREIEQARPSKASDTLASEDRIVIVAFNDPNDLLSYEPPDPADHKVNVVISVDKTYFGQIENPISAHRGYLDNERVWKLIGCGRDEQC